jgi:hypothetical protein
VHAAASGGLLTLATGKVLMFVGCWSRGWRWRGRCIEQQSSIAFSEGSSPLLSAQMSGVGMAVTFLVERKGGEIVRRAQEGLRGEPLALLVMGQAQTSALIPGIVKKGGILWHGLPPVVYTSTLLCLGSVAQVMLVGKGDLSSRSFSMFLGSSETG